MQRKTNPLVLIRYPLMRRKTLNIAFSWFTINLVYYGITYGIESFKVNVYIGIFLSGVSEIFAYLFTWFVLQKFGRRYTLAGTLVLGGIACFINIWIPVSFVGLRTAVAMFGKFFIASAFAIVYVFSAELFPTDVRTIGVGICSFCSCASGMLAPQVLFFGKLWTHLPLVTFSVMSVSAGLFALLLPETINVPLPQTIEEAEMMTRNIIARQQTQDGVHHLQPLKM
ncbi:organic cation transporter protein-like [Antedon mediterranea]|uniref:organic cation transporter protein-like n=1 Tax=Antedon mediterranea TaxID=105859 RepID=UPI003AF5F704